MSVDVTSIDPDSRDKWNEYVEQSPQGSPFHRLAALETQARHSGGTLHRLVGHKGQEPVGVFPLFEFRKGPLSIALSPPPDLWVAYLGPILLNMDKLKRRKRDRRQRAFIEGTLDWIDEEIDPWYTHVRTSGAYSDLRPFIWDGCEVTPKYTYLVDLDRDEDDLLMAFSRDARSNVTDDYETAFEITVGGRHAIQRIVEQVAARYEAQGKAFGVTTEFAIDLYDALPDGRVRPYTLSVDGEFVGGILVLAHGDVVYRWLGGVRTDTHIDIDLPVNDLLDWRVMNDAREAGFTGYDLVGADNPRINRYKSKFDPDLRSFHWIERGPRSIIELARAYNRIKS